MSSISLFETKMNSAHFLKGENLTMRQGNVIGITSHASKIVLSYDR